MPNSSSDSSTSCTTTTTTTPKTDLFLKEIYEELQREKQATPKPRLRTLNLTSQRNPPEPQVAQKQASTFMSEHTHSSQRMPAIDMLLSNLSKSSDSYIPPKGQQEEESPIDKQRIERTSTSSSNIKKKTGFRLADFRREFKRSVNDLNKNLSKSINALDYMGKHMTLTADDDHVLGKSFMSSSASTNSSAEMHHKTMDENLLRKNVKNGVLDPQPNVKVFHTNMAEMPIRDALEVSFQQENEVDARHSSSTSYSSNRSNFEYRSQKVTENGLDSKLLQREEFNTTYDTNMPEDSLKDAKKTLFSTNSSQHTTNSTSSLSNLSIKKILVGNKLELVQPANPNISQMKIEDLDDDDAEKNPATSAQQTEPAEIELKAHDPVDNATGPNNSEKLYKSSLKKKSKYEKDSAVEFKTNSISTTASAPKHLDISVNYRNKSPHSQLANNNMASYRHSSYDPKTFPNIKSNVGNSSSRHKPSMFHHKSTNSNNAGARNNNSNHHQHRSHNMVRHDNSARKFYVEERNKSNGLSEKSR